MLYDWTSTAALGVVRDIQPKEPLTLTGEGLWVCLISSGRCTASLADATPSPAGSALILPPQSAAAGHLVPVSYTHLSRLVSKLVTGVLAQNTA